METKKSLELLCPARDLEAGKLAINYGADAVYIGAGKFGARAAAGNTLTDIEKLIKYAHLYKSRVYITLNTILYENELQEAQKLIWDVYNLGADALIIQDMGVLEMNIPPIPLHASTQTHNYQIERIKFLEKAGFQRIILARELSITQINEIRNSTNVELEAFVHGALCVSMSGQCNFSQAMSGRSANRGECAQACRMPFDLLDKNDSILMKNKHFLSLKDLNASEYIQDLAKVGITSFKIEGRLKDNNYIINNTAHYRTILDQIIEEKEKYIKASSGKTIYSFIPDPEKSFNRGFTDYFINERHEQLSSFETPKSKGKFIGTVQSIEKDTITIETNFLIQNGDGLCFIDKNNELSGFNVNGVQGKKIFPSKMPEITISTPIYRNFDKEFFKQLETNKDKRKIDASFELSESNFGFILNAIDEDGFEVQTHFNCEKTIANDPLSSKNNILKQLNKTGETAFNIKAISLNISQDFFIPIGLLNEARRTVLSQLENKRIQDYSRREKVVSTTNHTYIKEEIDYQENVANSLSKKFYINHGVKNLKPAFELLVKEEQNGKTIMTTRYCLKYELNICPSKQVKNPNFDFQEPFYLKDKNRKYRLEFDCKNCLMKVLL